MYLGSSGHLQREANPGFQVPNSGAGSSIFKAASNLKKKRKEKQTPYLKKEKISSFFNNNKNLLSWVSPTLTELKFLKNYENKPQVALLIFSPRIKKIKQKNCSTS